MYMVHRWLARDEQNTVLTVLRVCKLIIWEGCGAETGEGSRVGRGGERLQYTHWQVRILKAIDDFLEEAAKDRAAALTILELDVCILTGHPAGLGPQVAVGAVKAWHYIVQ